MIRKRFVFGKCDCDLWANNIRFVLLIGIENNGFKVMEIKGHRTDGEGNLQAEHNYSAHQEDPSPSPEAIEEPNDRPASTTIWIAVIAAIVVMGLIYLVFIY